ncbi:hypothetical protein SeMB42_g01364 [Synchytrium endobioticum]|uniref:Uncharacterized protein n=1 Tax=Synchytrium endobioticum TaxID=286115 RepID=A0A507DLX1_9FUNG|nr:hypothetical protein SeMB42_g01364 [Synchytrium endobioticum]
MWRHKTRRLKLLSKTDIFLHLSQCASTDPDDEDIMRMVSTLSQMRRRAIQAGIAIKPPAKEFAKAIKEFDDPISVILRRMNTMVETKLPKNSPCTFDQLLSRPNFEAMSRAQLRFARAYYSYAFEKLKHLFMYIQSSVRNQSTERRDKLLAGLALVWNVLVVYYTLDEKYRSRCDLPQTCAQLELPIYETFSSCLDQQHVSELCREISLSFGNLRRIEELRIHFETEIADFQGFYSIARLYDAPMAYIMHMIHQFESLGHTRPWSGVWDYQALKQISPMERDALPVRLAHEYCIVCRAQREKQWLQHYLPRDASEALGVLSRLSEIETLIKHHDGLFKEYLTSLSGDGEAAQQDDENFVQPKAHGNEEYFPPVIDLTDDVDNSTQDYDNCICFDFLGNHIDRGNDRDHPTPELIDFLGKAEEQDLKSLDLSLGIHDPERLKGATLRIQEPSPLALSSNHWHDSEPSSHSYDKGKRPMNADGATDICPTQHSYDKGKRPMDASGATEISPSQQFQGGLDERRPRSKVLLKD